MTLAGAQLGALLRSATAEAGSRQLTAVTSATSWLNAPAPAATSLSGRPVFVQFGTYTCINWLRTLPYVRAWRQRYAPGLTVIEVHTPEFGFERDLENVRRALQHLKIDFAIALDNDYAIWRAFDNHYWPALYLLDDRGKVRYQHFGEGKYEQTEKAIQRLLSISSRAGDDRGPLAATAFELPADWQNLESPEIYLGHERSAGFASPGGAAPSRRRVYRAPARLDLNRWALEGEWTIGPQPAVLGSAPGRILCRFHARDVHLVMGPERRDARVRFRVSLDGQPPGSARGADLDEAGGGTVVDQRLYQLVRQPGPIADRTVAIEFLDAGVEAFAFTFG